MLPGGNGRNLKKNFFIVTLCKKNVTISLQKLKGPIHVDPFEASVPILSGTALEDDISTRIVHGNAANNGQFPFQVAITTPNNGIFGGSIISRSWVLTTGYGISQSPYVTMRFGSIHSRQGGVVQTSRRIITQTRFVLPLYTISLVHVPSPLTFNNAVTAIRLPRDSQHAETVFEGKTATISGWGPTTPNGPAQNLLRWTNVRVAPNAYCRRLFGFSIDSHIVCSMPLQSSGNQNVCDNARGGDRGGPLVVNESGVKTLIGVISYGPDRSPSLNCLSVNQPSVHARVTSHLPWIRQHTGIAIRA